MAIRHDPRCARCARPVVEISVPIDGETLVMRSCNRCGRSWHRGDDEVLLADVAEALVAMRCAARELAAERRTHA